MCWYKKKGVANFLLYFFCIKIFKCSPLLFSVRPCGQFCTGLRDINPEYPMGYRQILLTVYRCFSFVNPVLKNKIKIYSIFGFVIKNIKKLQEKINNKIKILIYRMDF